MISCKQNWIKIIVQILTWPPVNLIISIHPLVLVCLPELEPSAWNIMALIGVVEKPAGSLGHGAALGCPCGCYQLMLLDQAAFLWVTAEGMCSTRESGSEQPSQHPRDWHEARGSAAQVSSPGRSEGLTTSAWCWFLLPWLTNSWEGMNKTYTPKNSSTRPAWWRDSIPPEAQTHSKLPYAKRKLMRLSGFITEGDKHNNQPVCPIVFLVQCHLMDSDNCCTISG